MKKEPQNLFSIDWTKPLQSIVKITPEEASAVLDDYNDKNRLMRKAGSVYIANQIISGEWASDHPQPICFSDEGKLLDGQHRLAGVVLANQAVMASCRFGVRADLIKYIDTGISRTLGDRVEFVENKAVNATISGMIAMRHAMVKRYRPSPEEALSLFHEMRDSYIAIAECRMKRRLFGTMIISLAFADYHHRYGNEAVKMYQELFKLTTDCQPAQALKTFIATTHLKGPAQYHYIVSACLANHEGREVKILRASSWR